MSRAFKYLFLPLVAALVPTVSFAHEVYVLSPQTVAHDLSMPPLQVFSIINQHTGQFFFWMFLVGWAILTVFSIGISKGVERFLDPRLLSLKKYAPLAGRITIGAAVVASGIFGSLFGPELPLQLLVPTAFVPSAEVLFIVCGVLLLLGFLTRVAATIMGLVYILAFLEYGFYLLTYINYFGEILIALIVGNRAFALDRLLHHRYPHHMHNILKWFEGHAFLFLRVCFGISLIYASMYAKFLHAQLALDTVTTYHLTNYFHFDPAFIVLGAFAIELLIGLFILFGLEVRFATLFLLFFLTLSLLYFGEAVWPHIILAGGALSIFMNGYDRYTLEWGVMKRLRGKRAMEPVL